MYKYFCNSCGTHFENDMPERDNNGLLNDKYILFINDNHFNYLEVVYQDNENKTEMIILFIRVYKIIYVNGKN